MAIRQIQALLAPFIAQSNPELTMKDFWGPIKSSKTSHWGRYTITSPNPEEIALQSIKIENETIDFRVKNYALLKSIEGMSEKFWERLIGAGIDIFADIPLAHTCVITGYKSGEIRFENTLPFWKVEDVPRHTKKSYDARINRMGAEALAEASGSDFAIRLLSLMINRGFRDFRKFYSEDMLQEKDYSFNKDERFTIGIKLGGKDTEASLRGRLFNIHRDHDGAGYLIIDEAIPDSMANYIRENMIGKDLTSVVENDLFQGLRITHIDNSGGTFIRFEDQPGNVRKIREGIPEIEDVVEELIGKEKKVLSRQMTVWDEKIAELDENRKARPENHYKTAHIYRQEMSGNIRKM